MEADKIKFVQLYVTAGNTIDPILYKTLCKQRKQAICRYAVTHWSSFFWISVDVDRFRQCRLMSNLTSGSTDHSSLSQKIHPEDRGK